MPENFPSKTDSTLKSDTISPKKKDEFEIPQVQYGAQKNQKNLGQNVQNVYSGNVPGIGTLNKGLNYSMGHNFKEKFNLMHGQQIELINNKNLNYEGKDISSGVNQNKTIFYQSNKVGSSRFS